MSYLDNMLSKLTDVFKKNKDSNIGKLFTIIAKQTDDLQSTLDKMELWRDIDEAEGFVLDRMGSEFLQEYRGGVSDEEYRLKLKTRIIVNYLSDGDIETIIKLLEVYLGDHLVSVQKGADVKDGPFIGEPAMLLITIRGHETYGIPFTELARVLTGGVGTQWQYLLERELTISDEYQRWIYPFENFAGNLIAGGDQVSNDNRLSTSNFEMDDSYSKAMNDYPICGDFSDPFPNENRDYASPFELTYTFSSSLNEYMVCSGDNSNDNRVYESSFELSSVYSAVLQVYPVCGNFVAGEVI